MLDQLEMIYYLFQIITQSDLGESQLSTQPLLRELSSRQVNYNFLCLTPKSLKILLIKCFIFKYNSYVKPQQTSCHDDNILL